MSNVAGKVFVAVVAADLAVVAAAAALPRSGGILNRNGDSLFPLLPLKV